MGPRDVLLFGTRVATWNLVFVAGALLGYVVLRRTLACGRPPRTPGLLPLRWLATVYLSALGAQLFAYAFDLNTTALPPPSVHPVRYYLDPFAGPKTLYGAIVFLPVTLLAVSGPALRPGAALDAWTPAMFAVLAVARFGCFLQGCCYGVHSDAFGFTFPPGGAVHRHQLAAGLIAPGAPPLPVVPTQLLEAAVLAALCVWALRAAAARRTGLFVHGVAAYSAVRFVLELLRDDPDRNVLGPLSTSQWIALVVLVAYGAWARVSRPAVALGVSASPR